MLTPNQMVVQTGVIVYSAAIVAMRVHRYREKLHEAF